PGRVAVLAGPGRFEVASVEMGRLAHREVRVAVAGCGICGSNLPLWEGRSWFEYPRPPGAPGHEAWGRVAEVGEGLPAGAAPPVGAPVAVVCDRAFAEWVDVPAQNLVALPSALGERDFPGEALGSAFNAAARAAFASGQVVCVVGAGFLGNVLVALAARAGARVVAVSRRPWALSLASAMGAAHLLVHRGGPDEDAAV